MTAPRHRRATVATKICEDLVSFANYGFPESHAWSFALIAYVTAYLKAHHPTEFFVGLLNAQPMGFYPVSTLVHDAKRHGVEVRPPCLARGSWECTARVAGDARRLEVRARHRRQGDRRARKARERAPFTSIADVVERGKLTRAEVLAFAQAGAFEAWAPDRRHAAWEGLARLRRRPPARAGDGARTHDPVPIDRASTRASRLSRGGDEHLWTSDGVRARAAQARRRDRQHGARDDARTARP